ncbi:MAG: NlpC/P60 family protein, partial [Bacteroidetes bacterium]|nr:NlpC/P60 family protein [Bacteroidota bacterium]
GIDCSGLTQVIFKANSIHILRDAAQQATQGETISLIDESGAGDLAFFDNDEGIIIHVGLLCSNHEIIHASGKVRMDKIDHIGIYNAESQKYTHNLRTIKRLI